MHLYRDTVHSYSIDLHAPKMHTIKHWVRKMWVKPQTHTGVGTTPCRAETVGYSCWRTGTGQAVVGPVKGGSVLSKGLLTQVLNVGFTKFPLLFLIVFLTSLPINLNLGLAILWDIAKCPFWCASHPIKGCLPLARTSVGHKRRNTLKHCNVISRSMSWQQSCPDIASKITGNPFLHWWPSVHWP